MTASNAVTRSIRLAGSNPGGGDNTAVVQKYQRQMKSNALEKKEENQK